MIVLVVCGGRDYQDKDFVFASLDRAAKRKEVTVLFEGGANGADRLAREWAIDRGVQCVTIHANWKKYGKSAGPKRNKSMLTAAVGVARVAELDSALIAFPGGTGTAGMIAIAKCAGVTVWQPSGGAND